MSNVDKWLISNRCWTRACNIAHVRYQLMCDGNRADFHTAPDGRPRAFWELILERLED